MKVQLIQAVNSGGTNEAVAATDEDFEVLRNACSAREQEHGQLLLELGELIELNAAQDEQLDRMSLQVVEMEGQVVAVEQRGEDMAGMTERALAGMTQQFENTRYVSSCLGYSAAMWTVYCSSPVVHTIPTCTVLLCTVLMYNVLINTVLMCTVLMSTVLMRTVCCQRTDAPEKPTSATSKQRAEAINQRAPTYQRTIDRKGLQTSQLTYQATPLSSRVPVVLLALSLSVSCVVIGPQWLR